MMKKLSFAILGLLLAHAVYARDFDYTYRGQTLTYTVIDEAARTVKTKDGIDGILCKDHIPGNVVAGDLVIPDNVKNGAIEYTVAAIGNFAFSNCKELTAVSIPASVKSMGKCAFSSCIYLKKTEFSSIESICSMQFVDEDSNPLVYAEHLYINGIEITELDIPESVTTIGDYAFGRFIGLRHVTIPNTVTKIGEEAFVNCFRLKTLSIGNSVETICFAAFERCLNLTGVIIPNSVKTIGECAFAGCESISTLSIGNSVESIEEAAFYGCKNLTNVIIPNSVKTIGEGAFGWCTNLTIVTLPPSVETIGKDAFIGCEKLSFLPSM